MEISQIKNCVVVISSMFTNTNANVKMSKNNPISCSLQFCPPTI